MTDRDDAAKRAYEVFCAAHPKWGQYVFSPAHKWQKQSAEFQAAWSAAIEAARKVEREACAKVADDAAPHHLECGIKIAAQIRARGGRDG